MATFKQLSADIQ